MTSVKNLTGLTYTVIARRAKPDEAISHLLTGIASPYGLAMTGYVLGFRYSLLKAHCLV
jgi:hypothetical protein